MDKKLKNHPIKFTYNFEINKKSADSEADFLIIGYASTPALDRHGEIITEQALKSAAGSLLKKPNNILFLNHNYDRPIGVIVESKFTAGGLMIKARISKTEMNLREQIEEGLWGAFSVGGIVKDFEEIKDKEGSTEGYKITDIELVEVSLVGVPANPEATLVDVISKSFNLNKEQEQKESENGGEEMKELKKKKKDEELEEDEELEKSEEENDSEDGDSEDDDSKKDNEEESEEELDEDDNEDDEDDEEDEDDSDEDDFDEEKSFNLENEVKSLHKKIDSVLELADDIKEIKEATVSLKKSEETLEDAEDVDESKKKEKKLKRKGTLSGDKETEEEKLLKKIESMSLKEIMDNEDIWSKLDDETQKEIKNKYIKGSFLK